MRGARVVKSERFPRTLKDIVYMLYF